MQPLKSLNLAAILVAAFAANVNTLAGSNTRLSKKRNGRGAPGAYGRGLRNAITAKAAAKLEQRPGLRDEHGAFTLVGREPLALVMNDGVLITADGQQRYGSRNGRKWLAGISAQRGY